jgi:hypothetical protein
MGGNVVVLLMEHYPDTFSGALSVCGAVGGEEEIDYLLSWALLAEAISGIPVPIGGTTQEMVNALLGKVSPALGTPTAPTEAGKAFVSALRNLTGGPRPFYLQGLAAQYQANFSLLTLDADRSSLPVGAATNVGQHYSLAAGLGMTSVQLDAAVRRLAALPGYRDATAHPDAVPTTGKIDRPLLTLHTTGDMFVPISQEVAYRQKVDAAGKGDLLVQRAIRDPDHCGFSDAEYITAWNDLVSWVQTGTWPAGDDLSGDLSTIGKAFTSPLRPGDPGTP